MRTAILTLLFLLISATGGHPQATMNIEVVNGSSGEPSYYIITYTTSPVVNENDIFQINLYISGAGNVTQSNIRVSIPPYVVKEQAINLYSRDYYTYKDNDREYIINRLEYKASKQYPIFTITPSNITYKRVVLMNPTTDSEYKKLIGALDWPSYPNSPWIIDFTIADDAPEGDHEIIIDIYYKDSDRWYTQRERVKLHINYWYEDDIYQYLLVIVSVLTIIYMIYEFYTKLEWKYFLMILLLVLVSLMIILIYR